MLEEIIITLIAIFSISFVALLWKDVVLLTVSLLIMTIFALTYFHKRNDLIIFLIGSITGAFTESICIYFGAWSYANPNYLIPIWLPILWGLATLVVRRFSLEIDKKIK